VEVQYLIAIEKATNNYSAYAPDLPGCITTGSTIEETIENMKEAIALRLETMTELGIPIPEPKASSTELLAGSAETRLIEVAA
jgi:predicted RNase H-like HicB family nuclease